jgi:hypothetical protein
MKFRLGEIPSLFRPCRKRHVVEAVDEEQVRFRQLLNRLGHPGSHLIHCVLVRSPASNRTQYLSFLYFIGPGTDLHVTFRLLNILHDEIGNSTE